MASVVAVGNLGNEFDLGVIETNKIHVKIDGTTITRDVSGVLSAVAPPSTVTVGDGLDGDGSAGNPVVLDASSLPSETNPANTSEFVLSTVANAGGARVAAAEVAALLWGEGIDDEVAAALPSLLAAALTEDVQDAFGNHLFYALP